VDLGTPPIAEPVVVSPETASAFERLAPVAAVVGVASAGHGSRALHVLDAAAAALATVLPGQRTAVVAVEASPADGTRDVLRAWSEAHADGPARLWFDPSSSLGPPPALVSLLVAARRLGASACAIVDASLRLSPKQAVALLEPVVAGDAELACPVYARAVSEGTLTSNLLVPLTRALYGHRVGQVAGGCLALSGAQVARALDGGGPDLRGSGPGLEIWLATEVLAAGATVVEVGLGPKPVESDGPSTDLATTLVHAVGPVFTQMDRHAEVWLDARGSVPVPRRGEPAPVSPDRALPSTERMVRGFRLGLKDLLPVWEQVVPEATLGRLYPLGLLGADEFRFPPDLWARVVSDFAVAHHERRLPSDHLLRALTPLYLGRVAAFLLDARGRSADQLEGLVESTALAFEAEKPSLVARWR
jgi:glucosylglycerate synthase